MELSSPFRTHYDHLHSRLFLSFSIRLLVAPFVPVISASSLFVSQKRSPAELATIPSLRRKHAVSLSYCLRFASCILKTHDVAEARKPACKEPDRWMRRAETQLRWKRERGRASKRNMDGSASAKELVARERDR